MNVTPAPNETAATLKSSRLIVAAAIVDSLANPTQLLCAARAYPEHLRGQFELPGGKVEPTETAQQALHREIFEELGTRIALDREVSPPPELAAPGTNPLAWPILQGCTMRVWVATVEPGQPLPQLSDSHCELVWQPLVSVGQLPWLPTNLPIVRHLVVSLISELS